MSPHWNWDSPTPYLAGEYAPPPSTKKVWGGGTHLQMRGWGSQNSDDWRKNLALCLLCEFSYTKASIKYVHSARLPSDFASSLLLSRKSCVPRNW
jgi:hypothetical protein